MTFKRKLLLCVGIPSLVFILAAALLGWTLQRSNNAFGHYIDQDQAIENALRDMYAQGLQMGQALRNIVLDPANRQAYTNLEAAQKQFRDAQERLEDLSQGTETTPAVGKMLPLSAALFEQQRRVLEAAADDGAAASRLLVSSETPAWRALRGALLSEIDTHGKAIQTSFQAGRDQILMLTAASSALVVLAVLVALFFTVSLLRTVNRELGTEPSDLRAAMDAVANGDLTVSVPGVGTAQGGRSSVAQALNLMAERLASSIAQVSSSAQQIRVGSAEIETGNHDLSGRTEQTASNLEETAASMEQMSGAIKQSADSARIANQLAGTAGQSAEQGGRVVGDVVRTMDEINQASGKISDIIGVIDGIAFQTNILALNAAVEAARAGEQGRGFAVVAGEVRTLAQRSAQAAKEIKELIGNSVEKVSAGSQLVHQAGATMKEIVDNVERVRDIIGEISSSASEQAEGVNQINAAIANLDQMTQQNAALVEQSAAAASSMSAQAARLTEIVSTFRLRDNQTGRPPAQTTTPMRQPRSTPKPAGPGASRLPVKTAPSQSETAAQAGSPPRSAPPASLGSPRKTGPTPVDKATPADGEWDSF